jgi:hypothetical protein
MTFISVMKAIGHDFKVVFTSPVTQQVERVAEVGLSIAFPAFGSLFHATANAVIMAEQSASILPKTGTGPQKLAAVLQLLEPVIAQGLVDAGKSGKTEEVINYINAVVLILNTTPSPKPIALPPAPSV